MHEIIMQLLIVAMLFCVPMFVAWIVEGNDAGT